MDNSLFIQMPTALSIPMSSLKYDWGLHTQAEPGLGGRSVHQAHGKVIGGSSSINGMVYVRGNFGDFEQWRQQGAEGWGYADVLPYFQRAEDCLYGADAYRGGDGPVGICNGNNMRNPLYRVFIEAGREAGYGVTADYNGFRQEGFGRMDMTVRGGVRCSTANAYLKPALSRPYLTLQTRAFTTRIVMDGKRAVGVEYRHQDKVVRVKALREVILCASALKGHGFQVHLGANKPLSRGRVQLSSGDPEVPPDIVFNYLSEETDKQACRDGLRLTREIFAQPAFADYLGDEVSPGPSVQTDDEIDAWVAQSAATAYHPCGSCHMGSDAMAVVDTQCRV